MCELHEKIKKEILKQFNNGGETEYGEPQAWIYLNDGRSIEVVLEMESLKPWEYYYSIRLHCSDEEFENNDFHSTYGVIDTNTTRWNDLDWVVRGVDTMSYKVGIKWENNNAYDNCCKAIKNALLESPITYGNGMTQLFNNDVLENIRDTYGYDLYTKCISDVENEINGK